ncbi:MAG: Asp-tRNA(Asn)/Glu-tRNA(Gln) amidotransferase subunit GatA [Candidatus Krumholzibacteria bacterium]|nr:Asp-tRNA(Asn)/Glu-tRNA(Gln) amidotransferase subunit GatA [Candidatus Krumholzibacteria bacterium]
MHDLARLTAIELLDLYKRRETTPSEAVRACLDGIDSKEGVVGAFLHIDAEGAMARALRLDGEGIDGRPLFGVPVAVKDNICTSTMPTTCASRILGSYQPPYDATVVRRLEDAGAVIIGKTNLDEFAMGSSTENSAFHTTRNPWDESRAPGGSSGGSAAAVAAGMVPIALGSDTGGSIRQPASFCGVTGMKGTYGRVSRYGLIAFASSLDQIGPIARDVDDCALLMRVLSGKDPLDSTSISGETESWTTGTAGNIEGLRVGVPLRSPEWEMDGAVRELFARSVSAVMESGCTTGSAELPGMDKSIACYYIIANAEASSNLARFDGVRYGMRSDAETLIRMYEETRGEGFGAEVKRRILLGTYVLSSGYYDRYYSRARRARAEIKDDFKKIFEEFDAIILPTTPEPAFELGERLADPVSMYLSDIFTTPASIAGLPAISVPVGVTGDGLPVGMQIIAGEGREDIVFRVARVLQGSFGFVERYYSRSGEREGDER